MSEPYLTMAEIEVRYPNQWVLIANPTRRGRSLAPTGGQVVVHAADRAEFERLWDEWDGQAPHLAVQYVGKFPDELDEPVPAESEVARQ